MTGRMTSESYFAISSLQSPVRGLCAGRYAHGALRTALSVLAFLPPTPITLSSNLLLALDSQLWTLNTIFSAASCPLPAVSCFQYSSLTQPAQGLFQYPLQGPLFPLDNGAHGPLGIPLPVA